MLERPPGAKWWELAGMERAAAWPWTARKRDRAGRHARWGPPLPLPVPVPSFHLLVPSRLLINRVSIDTISTATHRKPSRPEEGGTIDGNTHGQRQGLNAAQHIRYSVLRCSHKLLQRRAVGRDKPSNAAGRHGDFADLDTSPRINPDIVWGEEVAGSHGLSPPPQRACRLPLRLKTYTRSCESVATPTAS